MRRGHVILAVPQVHGHFAAVRMVSLVRLAVTKATLTFLNISLLLFNDLITNGFAESLGPAPLPASAPWQPPVSVPPTRLLLVGAFLLCLVRLCLLLFHPRRLPPLRLLLRLLRLTLGSLPFLWWLPACHSLRTLFGWHYPMLRAAGESTQAVAVRRPS